MIRSKSAWKIFLASSSRISISLLRGKQGVRANTDTSEALWADGFLLVWQLWLMVVVRATRAANNAPNMSDRSMGIVAMIVAMTMVIGGIGSGALMDPSRMTVLLIVIGLTPVMSRAHSLIPSRPPRDTEGIGLQAQPATV
jgi:hypothetical protein